MAGTSAGARKGWASRKGGSQGKAFRADPSTGRKIRASKRQDKSLADFRAGRTKSPYATKRAKKINASSNTGYAAFKAAQSRGEI